MNWVSVKITGFRFKILMEASANPYGTHHQEKQSFVNGGGVASTSNPCNGNSGPGSGHDNSSTASAMHHNPGIDTQWTSEEQAILDDGLIKYALESRIICYAKIAMQLPNKTVREVALRTRLMNKKELSKRRKDDHSRKSKDKREKITESSSKSSQLPSRPGGHPYSIPAVSLDNDDGISYKAIGGTTGELLEQNAQFFRQVSANFTSFQVQENISLLCQARDNLIKIMESVNDTPEIMRQMPPLPVKLNEELTNTILPPTTLQLHS